MMRALILLFTVCMLNGSVSAHIMVGNQRLDHAIWPAHKQKLVVAGEIRAMRTVPEFRADFVPQVEIKFSVTSVILGDPKYGMSLMHIDLSHFDWPHGLLKLEKEARCILVMRCDEEDAKEKLSVVSVVPAHCRSLKRVENGEQALRILESELVAELEKAKSWKRQTALLIQLAPILTKSHVRQVASFSMSKNQWVKRAALAGLIYATEDKAYIRLAAEDVQKFLSTTKEDDLIEGTYAPYPYFFNHYFFLEKRSWTFGSRWDEKEAEKHLRILNTMFNLNIIDKHVTKILNPMRD